MLQSGLSLLSSIYLTEMHSRATSTPRSVYCTWIHLSVLFTMGAAAQHRHACECIDEEEFVLGGAGRRCAACINLGLRIASIRGMKNQCTVVESKRACIRGMPKCWTSGEDVA